MSNFITVILSTNNRLTQQHLLPLCPIRRSDALSIQSRHQQLKNTLFSNISSTLLTSITWDVGSLLFGYNPTFFLTYNNI